MEKRMRAASSAVMKAARELRKAPTAAEVALWELLRRGQVDGVRFRRQHAVDQFIVDFFAASCRLAIEVDGEVHDSQREQDEARTAYLATQGIRVIRFRNEEVLRERRRVREAIRAAIRDAAPTR